MGAPVAVDVYVRYNVDLYIPITIDTLLRGIRWEALLLNFHWVAIDRLALVKALWVGEGRHIFLGVWRDLEAATHEVGLAFWHVTAEQVGIVSPSPITLDMMLILFLQLDNTRCILLPLLLFLLLTRTQLIRWLFECGIRCHEAMWVVDVINHIWSVSVVAIDAHCFLCGCWGIGEYLEC